MHTPSPSDPDLKHLGIVLTKPKKNELGTREILLVKVTSIRRYVPHDDTCLLNTADYSFIKHPSYVYYKFADKYDAQIIKDGHGSTFINHGVLEDKVLDRVTKGLIASPYTPNSLKKCFQEW